RWLELGRAHRTLWTVTGTGTGRSDAEHCFHTVLALVSDDPIAGTALAELADLARLSQSVAAPEVGLDALDGARELFERLPARHPDRPRSAAVLGVAALAAYRYGHRDLDAPDILALLTEARQAGPDDTPWQSAVGKVAGA